jgi:hypothetical protein
MRSTLTGNTKRRIATLAVLAVGAVLLFAVTAQPAAAEFGWDHGGATCVSCHGGEFGTPEFTVPTTDAACTDCHTGGFESRQTAGAATRTCWTCHEADQDMSTEQSAAGCGTAAAGAACHNQAGHFGSNVASCVSCHGTVPGVTNPGDSEHHNNSVNNAPTCGSCHDSLHAEYVPGVACTTCHGGYDTTHPNPATVASPTVALAAKPTIVKYGLTTIVSGSVKSGTTGLAGKTVALQAKPFGSADFAGVTTATTAADGAYVFVAQSPTLLTTYRVVTYGGVVNTTVVKPSLKSLDVKVRPDLTIALSKTSFALGGKEIVTAKLNPARTAGKVTFTVQRKVSGTWKTQLTKSVALTAGSGYTKCSLTYKPLKRGSYRVKASIAAMPELAAFTTLYKTWTVK